MKLSIQKSDFNSAIVQDEQGQRVFQSYNHTPKEVTEQICKAVNSHEELVEALKETLEQFKYALGNHNAILQHHGVEQSIIAENSTVIKAETAIQNAAKL